MKSPVSRFTHLIASLSTVATVLAGLAPTAANASDGKDYTALGCRSYYTGVPEPLPDALGGIFNNQTFNMGYICPIVHDEGGSGIASAVAHISTYTKGTATCTLYSASPLGAYRYLTRAATTGTGRRAIYFGALGGYTNGVYSLFCYLPSAGTLHTYTINEG
jgi:hypothetical protein